MTIKYMKHNVYGETISFVLLKRRNFLIETCWKTRRYNKSEKKIKTKAIIKIKKIIEELKK